MNIILFIILLGIGIYLIYIRKARWYLTVIGGLYFAALTGIILVDWAQAGWAQGYITPDILFGSWGIWYLESIAFIGLGIWAFRRERNKLIGSTYNKTIELNPDNADAYYKRGDVYDEIGEYEKAIADYSKAIELDPNHALAYYSRGCAYAEKGEYEKAIADYNKVIELNPSDAYAYYSRGLAYHEKSEVLKQ